MKNYTGLKTEARSCNFVVQYWLTEICAYKRKWENTFLLKQKSPQEKEELYLRLLLVSLKSMKSQFHTRRVVKLNLCSRKHTQSIPRVGTFKKIVLYPTDVRTFETSFKTVYVGQFTSSTQLIIRNYHDILSHRRSTTVSLKTCSLY